ncbi:MAG: BMC domain-containing protein [Symploca sp. SIO3C6]|uniref:BMC domain-containing protein n=1 Tax=Symploca sp. SIO1C4 TaxID=2607765 RepID=A0A6B3N8D1_9CYAN|nr:BMC domain-containing protein [Symploca sp. SIO3C6]NER27733.1 BMC domain-containing protein [Symploca sp. SIO1C4]NET03511.1 BMC domain-containing protein [Symploca sp. SIO2B6]
MHSYRSGIASQRPWRGQERRSQDALGLVCTLSFPVIVSTADAMLKAASVTLVGYEKTGSGQCTAIVRGTIAEVRIAVQAGVEHAQQEGRLHSSTVLPRPFPNLEVVFPIGSKLLEQLSGYNHGRISNQALGLLETRGFPAMVGAADAMLKAADVQLSAYETIGDGLCTAIIRGAVANVAMALQVGIAEAQRIGEIIAVTVIPRPLEDLEKSLPVAQCLIEAEPQPLVLPIKVKEEVKELVELPDLGKLPMSTKDS